MDDVRYYDSLNLIIQNFDTASYITLIHCRIFCNFPQYNVSFMCKVHDVQARIEILVPYGGYCSNGNLGVIASSL